MKRTPSIVLIGIMLVALAAIAVTAFVAWNRITAGTKVTVSSPMGFPAAVDIGGAFELTGHHGRTVKDGDFRGRFMLVFFGYGYCPDVCPTGLATVAAALDALGDKAGRVQPLFITVDPARDTAEFLADYVGQFHPKFVGLTGTEAKIADVAKKYRVYYRKAENGSATDYLVDHSSFVYLMGPDGKFLTMFRHAMRPDDMAAAIASYIAKAKGGAGTGKSG